MLSEYIDGNPTIYPIKKTRHLLRCVRQEIEGKRLKNQHLNF